MHVTRDQMHNAIECYSKQLSRARQIDKIAGNSLKKMAETLALSPETTRNATMEKICRQVLDKIARVVASPVRPGGTSGPTPGEGMDSRNANTG
jgi:hypothetical protein